MKELVINNGPHHSDYVNKGKVSFVLIWSPFDSLKDFRGLQTIPQSHLKSVRNSLKFYFMEIVSLRPKRIIGDNSALVSRYTLSPNDVQLTIHSLV